MGDDVVTQNSSVLLTDIDAVLFREATTDGPMGIVFWLSGGITLFRPLDNEEERERVWEETENIFSSDGFVRFHNVFFRPQSLEMLERRAVEGRDCIRFLFRNEKTFSYPYLDPAHLVREFSLVSEILEHAQMVMSGIQSTDMKQ